MDVKIACPCPIGTGTKARHPKGDIVTLRDTLGYVGAMTVRNTVRLLRVEGANVAQALAGITEAYLLAGISGWTLVDDQGAPREISNGTIHEHLLSHLDQAMTVSDAADELYQASVMLPLVSRDYASSPTTPTVSPDDGLSTSPMSEPTLIPKPSRPSSITTTPMDDTEPITSSPDGDFSSSPSVLLAV